jgi:hypothetical protein
MSSNLLCIPSFGQDPLTKGMQDPTLNVFPDHDILQAWPLFCVLKDTKCPARFAMRGSGSIAEGLIFLCNPSLIFG